MYNVVVDYIESRIEPRLPPEVNVKISEALTYMVEGYRYTWAFQHQKWDGRKILYNMVEQRFRTGLKWRVCSILDRDHVDYKIVDLRTPKPANLAFNLQLGSINPHQFQIDAIDSTQGNSHGIIASPTGTGKSVCIALLVARYNVKSLVIENSRVLLDQMYEFIDSVLPGRVGIIGDGDFELNDVVVATYQSLATILGIGKKRDPTSKASALLDWFNDLDLLIFDESHEADTDSMAGICELVKANKFFGFTATPYGWAYASERGKNLPLESNVGVKIYDSRDTVDFIKLGLTVPLYVSRPIMPTVPMYQWFKPGDRHDVRNYKEVIDNQVINHDNRTQAVCNQVRNLVEGRNSTYVYYNRISFGEKLCSELSDLDPIMLQGSTSRDKRTKIFRDLETKKRLVVVSDIGSYGLNIRSLNAIVIGHPQRDSRQLCGRVCRSSAGKSFGIVIDPIDWVPILYTHSEMRLRQCKKDGNVIIG